MNDLALAATTTTPIANTMTGAEALVGALIEAGVDTIFGYPGGAIMPTYDALYDVGHNRLRHVLVRHEQGAAHAAEGYARASGSVGVCLVTSGPGATNLITGMADAMMDSTPLVCICGQVYSHLLGADAFQECDIVGLSLAATKWSYQITDPAEVAAVVRDAFRIARDGRPGPVLIDITRDAQLASFDPGRAREPLHPPASPGGYARACRDLGALDVAADLVNRAERPYLLLGQGVLISGAEKEARELAEKAGMPVASTLLGLSALDADHPLNVGMLGMHGNYAPNMLTNEADVIVAVGMRFDDRVTGRTDGYAPQARIVHIEIDPAEIGRNVPAEVALVADAREALLALLPRVRPRSHPDWLARFRALADREREAVVDAELRPASGALRMGEVVAALSTLSEGRAAVVSDVGQHQMYAARYYRFARPRSHFTSGGLGTMGFALPAALGVALAAPDRPVVAVAGDGGFQMSLQELGTIAQERLAVKMVVLNNGYLGMVRQWQELFFDERYSHVELPSPDFVALAGAYGIPGAHVARREELVPALRAMLEAPGPYILEATVARTENVFPMIPAGAAVDEIRLS